VNIRFHIGDILLNVLSGEYILIESIKEDGIKFKDGEEIYYLYCLRYLSLNQTDEKYTYVIDDATYIHKVA